VVSCAAAAVVSCAAGAAVVDVDDAELFRHPVKEVAITADASNREMCFFMVFSLLFVVCSFILRIT
jgi:hypothetical protein